MKTKAVSFRMDSELKDRTEEIMQEVGMNMSTAFTVFCKAIVREGGMPQGVLVDPFYRKENIDELKRRIRSYESGETQMIDMTAEFEDEIL